MYLPDVDYHDADSLEDALQLMERYAPDACWLAGGTDLLVDLKVGRMATRHLVSLGRIDALRGIRESSKGLRIGALVTISELDRHPALRNGLSPLHDATSQMAAQQIRNSATVGGNVASAVPCADLPPILTALEAVVEISSLAGERIVPLTSFFRGARKTVLNPKDLLSAIIVPHPPQRCGAAYSRFGLREGNAIAVAGVAALIHLARDETIEDARIVLGAVSPVPVLVEAARDTLIGETPGERPFARAARAAADASKPICDVRGSVEFRRQIVAVMARRALATAARRAKGVE